MLITGTSLFLPCKYERKFLGNLVHLSWMPKETHATFLKNELLSMHLPDKELNHTVLLKFND